MGKRHKPRRGSMGFSPRKRAKSIVPSFSSWPEIDGKPKLQGFAGFKAGMTHLIVNDTRKRSTTENQEIVYPVTVIEVPPLKVVALKFYQRYIEGIKIKKDVWMNNIEKNFVELERRLTIPADKSKEDKSKNDDANTGDLNKEMELLINDPEIEEIRALVATQPYLAGGISSKTPDLMEIRIGGGNIKERIEYGFKILGKDIRFIDFLGDQKVVDISAITKGKGFQGHIKRWGVKLQPRKNSKHRRMIGTLGPHNPSYILPTVPQAGQMGFHQRTEYNKRVMAYVPTVKTFTADKDIVKELASKTVSKNVKKIFSDNDISLSNNVSIKEINDVEWMIIDEKRTYKIKVEETKVHISESYEGKDSSHIVGKVQGKLLSAWSITPKGGFLNYGLIKDDAVIIHGSVPGPSKRLIRFRDPVRFSGKIPDLPITYVSNSSKQGA